MKKSSEPAQPRVVWIGIGGLEIGSGLEGG